MHYENVCTAFFSQYWAIQPEALPPLVELINRWSVGVKMDPDAAEKLAAERRQRVTNVKGKVGVLPIRGVIAQRVGLVEKLSGGAGTEQIGKQFDELMDSEDVRAIVLDIDSPGGSVFGVEELAGKVMSARGRKPVYAIANSLMASAAYWIGSSADRVIITPGGQAGSIGVVAMHVDYSQYNEKKGFQPSYITAGKYKATGHPDAPLSEEARSLIQEGVDDYYGAFVSGVAKARGTTPAAVRAGYGEGRVLTAKRAVDAGLADEIETFEGLMKRLGVESAKTVRTPRAILDADRAKAWRQREEIA